jgi:sialate O-acetylesterase
MMIIFSVAPCSASAEATQNPEVKMGSPTLTGQLGFPFSDHAVLQQQIPLPVWGVACHPETKITVQCNGQSKHTMTDAQGSWKVVLDPMTAQPVQSLDEAPPAHEMTIHFENNGEKAVTTLKNLLVGEVWLCAGQSNMAGVMKKNTSVHFPENSIAEARYPAFRQIVSGHDGKWVVCSPETAVDFKKVCFFFGRRIHQETRFPVGVINAAVGGSNIESWLNQQPYPTGAHFTQLIQPLIPYGMRGVVWYQGESNAKDGYDYLPKLSALIQGWRKAWQQSDSTVADGPRGLFPVYYVQLPGIGESDPTLPAMGDGRAQIRRAYKDALKIENTGMAICHDIGAKGEHPPNKYDTGIRLAQLALHRDYGKKNLMPSGPLYRSHRIEGESVRVQFDDADGLMIATKEGLLPAKATPEANIQWLSLRAEDGTWHWATAKIDGKDLIVSSPEVHKPTAVRYAHTNHPNGPLLYNKEAIPAAPFATDEP